MKSSVFVLLVLGIQILSIRGATLKRESKQDASDEENEAGSDENSSEGSDDETGDEGDEDDESEGDEDGEWVEDDDEEPEMTSGERRAMAERLKTSKLKVLSAGDVNNDEKLTYDELLRFFKSTSYAENAEKEAKELFDAYDKNGNGIITPDEVESIGKKK